MTKTVEILKVTKDKKKFIVETSEKEYKFSEDVIVEYMVLKGKTFTESEFKKIIKANEVDDLFMILLLLLFNFNFIGRI